MLIDIYTCKRQCKKAYIRQCCKDFWNKKLDCGNDDDDDDNNESNNTNDNG